MKKIISALFALVMLFSITACTGTTDKGGTTGDPNAISDPTYEPESKSLVIGSVADPSYWNPWGQFNAGRRDVVPLIYQTLIAPVPNLVDGGTDIYYVLASGYERIDETTYDVSIREGIYDTAGNPFTASDAVFCFESAQAQGNFATLNTVDSFEVINTYKFRVNTNESLAVGDFEDVLTTLPMVTQASFEASPDGMTTTPIGTTGYVLAEYTPGSGAVFEKADSYWNDAANESKSADDGYCPWWDCTKLDKIEVVFITDDSARAIALESGTIDIASSITVTDMMNFQSGKNAGNFNVGTYPGNIYDISFNASSSSVTSNYNLRMALAHCIDAQGVLDLALDGEGLVLKAWAFPTYVDWQQSWTDDDYFEYDLDLAKEYLEKFYAETGTTASTLNLRFVIQSGGTTSKIAESIQAYIVELVGNPTCVTLDTYDLATYEQMCLDPDAFDLLLLSSQSVTRIYSTTNWSRQADASKTQSGDDIWHSGDAKGQELLHLALNEETHSDATVAAFQAYINEMAYMKTLISNNTFAVGAGWIKNMDRCLGYKSALAVLALDYDWSQSGK